MRVERKPMIYDDSDELCQCVLAQSQGKLYAFLQVIDSGIDGKARFTARYWGEYSHKAPERSIAAIMEWGGKWPALPK